MLDVLEGQVLRRIFVPVYDDGRRRMRTNKELTVLYHDSVIRLQRLRWYGHLQRMSDERLMRVFQFQPYSSRPRGRPRNRWADAVRVAMGSTGTPPNFDRQEWERLVKDARDH
ncbi:hypothetical protein AAG570_008493 [Ranatra chinensis]|uniref:Uncharacterized protein n=1 Tax=Ranatra chinensis TaxID=642074 RepID=A0ABD0YR18_9HEMI